MDMPQVVTDDGWLAFRAAAPNSGQPVAVLVLGMHRSGTSALSGTLSHFGASVPGELLTADIGNERGYFENLRIVGFHDRLLSAFGSRWDDPRPLGEELFHSPVARSAARELAALLREEFGDEAMVLAKDPRMCRLVPVWVEALSHLGRRAVAVLPCRHPLEVAASLQRRSSFSQAYGLVLWLQHVLSAERATRGLPRCFTLYDDLLRDWRSLVGRIGAELGLTWPRGPELVGADVDAFLTSQLRHHRAAQDGLAPHDPLHRLCARSWDALKSLRADADDAAAQAELDEVACELNTALGALASLNLDPLHVYQREAALQAELAAQRAELAAIVNSTLWRATWPLRSVGSRLPKGARRALSRSAKLAWWTLTLRLGTKLAEQRRTSAARVGEEAGPSRPNLNASAARPSAVAIQPTRRAA